MQRVAFNEYHRKLIMHFLSVWHDVRAVRGAAARLWRFVLMEEGEIEWNWLRSENAKRFTDPKGARAYWCATVRAVFVFLIIYKWN